MPEHDARLTPEQQRDVGRAAARERRRKVPWKVLESRFGLSRERLRVLANEAAATATNLPSWHLDCGQVPCTLGHTWFPSHRAAEPEVAVGAIFSPPKPPRVEPLAPAPTAADPAVEEARRKELAAARAAKGRSSTNLTGGLGIVAQQPTSQSVLLGA